MSRSLLIPKFGKCRIVSIGGFRASDFGKGGARGLSRLGKLRADIMLRHSGLRAWDIRYRARCFSFVCGMSVLMRITRTYTHTYAHTDTHTHTHAHTHTHVASCLPASTYIHPYIRASINLARRLLDLQAAFGCGNALCVSAKRRRRGGREKHENAKN